MLRTIFKKKVNEDKLANVLINSLLHAMEVGFKDISGFHSKAREENGPEIFMNFDKEIL